MNIFYSIIFFLCLILGAGGKIPRLAGGVVGGPSRRKFYKIWNLGYPPSILGVALPVATKTPPLHPSYLP